MLKVLLTIFAAVAADQQYDAATNQIVDFKKNTTGPIGKITTGTGAPVNYKDAASVLNTNLLSNEYFVDTMTHFVRERIPERTVHAPGTGAFGYFEVTHDISHICNAKLFSEIGKKTPIVARFSLGFASIGVRDTTRDLRGFSVKFYTEEGNLDLLGLNTPVASVNDPIQFPHAIHAARRNPATNMPDQNAIWDFLTQRTEAIFIFLYILSDYGMPTSYRHMPGFPVHTFEVYNDEGVKSWVRFYFVPEAGVKNLNATEQSNIVASDPDYYARGLYNDIANGMYPRWNLKIQVLSEEDVKNANFNVFDNTKVLPANLYPYQPVGTFTLDKNVLNHFAEIEQLAFSPGNVVPGILGSPGKAFEARRFVYRDAQIYRLGANLKKIPVNRPMGYDALTYYRDGVGPVGDNGRDSPNYYPNSFNGPIPSEDRTNLTLSKIVETWTSNFDQMSDFYSNELSASEKTNLVNNLVTSISPCEESLKNRVIQTLIDINSELGNRVAEGLDTSDL